MVYSRVRVVKLIKLAAEILFYSVGIGILFLTVLTPVEPIGIENWITIFFPIGSGQYWFMTDYILLMLISPAVNILIKNMSKELHRNLLIGATVLWSVIPTFTPNDYNFDKMGWFVVLYLYGAYIRKYLNTEKQNVGKHFVVAAFSFLVVVASSFFLIYLGHITNMEVFTEYSRHWANINSVFILLAAVEVMVAFVKMKPYYNRGINILASATLGVYLIHDNDLFRPYLWCVILKTPEMYASRLLIVHAMVSILGVYLICSSIDLIRQYTIEKLFMGIVKKWGSGYEYIGEKRQQI
jgi:hypothetical protein